VATKLNTQVKLANWIVEIASRIDLENAVDYFILINLAYATDNTGKNIYTAKFKNKSPYFFIPWDMDGSFGNDKDGVRTDITNKILSNGLYDRLLKNVGFKTELYNRWLELRINELSATNIKAMFNYNYSILNENGIYIREQLVNGLSYNYTPSEMEFIETWIDERLAFLDAYFSSL
jgi:spore coat protein H